MHCHFTHCLSPPRAQARRKHSCISIPVRVHLFQSDCFFQTSGLVSTKWCESHCVVSSKVVHDVIVFTFFPEYICTVCLLLQGTPHRNSGRQDHGFRFPPLSNVMITTNCFL